MKAVLVTCILGLLVATTYAKPMTSSVRSWEGDFKLTGRKIAVEPAGKPKLFLWLYQLDEGAKGTCIGFSRENGDMALMPKPSEKGVQPVYSGHVVLFDEKGTAEIIVTYDVQGNGGQKWVEKYTYDGSIIKLASRSQYFGKHAPIWKDVTGTAKGK
jgi:hypothetical protein